MFKVFILLFLFQNYTMESIDVKSDFYKINIKNIAGDKLDLSQFKGKKILIVNVASECGYTPQYAQLEELYETYHEKLVVLGCPSNDFGGQEPGTEKEIVKFCQTNYGVSFPLTQKVGIKSNTHELYKWLTQKSLNGQADFEVKWNFHKFLIDEKGNLVASYPSDVTPLDERIIDWIN